MRRGLAALCLGLALVGGAPALSQPAPGAAQPGAAQPGAAQPGARPPAAAQPGPVQPGAAQPAQPGQPGAAQPGPMQPGPMQPGPVAPRQPRPRAPGQPGQGGVQLPPGHVPIAPPTQAPPPPRGPKLIPRDEHGHCPGHGLNDPPHHINFYQGLLGVDNEKSQSQNGLDRLLWRYHNSVDECDPKNQEPPLLAALINFSIVALVVYRFGKKPVMEGLAARKKTIMQNIDDATTMRADAEKRVADYKKKLSRIEERRAELREESRLAWEAEKARILAEASDKASRLRKDADFRVAQELKQAEADLMSEAVDGAVAAAEALIKKRIEERDQERLADDFVASLSKAFVAQSADRQGGSR